MRANAQKNRNKMRAQVNGSETKHNKFLAKEHGTNGKTSLELKEI